MNENKASPRIIGAVRCRNPELLQYLDKKQGEGARSAWILHWLELGMRVEKEFNEHISAMYRGLTIQDWLMLAMNAYRDAEVSQQLTKEK